MQELDDALKRVEGFENLYHYIADADIRSKDSAYAETQTKCLVDFLRALTERNIERAEAVTFLGPVQ